MIFRKEDRWCRLLLILVALAWHGWPFVEGKWPAYDDIVAQYWPWWTYLADSLREGRFPLWNPWVAGGMPYVTNPENALYYPPKLFLTFVPFFTGIIILRVFNAIIASVGMFCLLRDLRVQRFAAVAGAMMFSCGSFMAYEQVHIPYINTAVWWPWEFLIVRRLIRRASFGRAIGLASVGAFSFFGGSPGIFIIGHIALVFFALFSLLDLWLRVGIAKFWLALRRLILAAVLFSGLTCVLWLPTLEFVILSVRSGGLTDLGSYERFALTREGFLAMAFPWLHWKLGAPYPPLHPLPFVSIPYVGSASVFLALNALVSKRYFRFLAPSLALFPFAILMAMGTRTGFVEFIAKTVPTLGWFRWPHDYLLIIYILLSIGAALGLDLFWRIGKGVGVRLLFSTLLYLGTALAAMPDIFSLVVFLTGIIMASAAYVLFRLDIGGEKAFARPLSRVLAGAAVLCVAFDLMIFGSSYNITVDPQAFERIANSEIIGWLRKNAHNYRVSAATTGWQLYFKGQERAGQEHFPFFEKTPVALDRPLVEQAFRKVDPSFRSANIWRRRIFFEDQELWSRHYPVNAAMLFQYREISVYDPFMLRSVAELYREVPLERLWRLMSVRYVARPSEVLIDGLKPVFKDSAGVIHENTNALPPLWVVRSVRDGLSAERVRALLADSEFDPAEEALFEDRIPARWIEALKQAGKADEDRTAILEFKPELLVVEADLKRAACVVLNETFYPGWTATTADGRLLKIWRVNGALSAVFLGPGKHRVVFRFQPDLWYAGVLVSIACWLTSAIAVCGSQLRSARRAIS